MGLHRPCVSQERLDEHFQLSIVLAHGTGELLALRSLHECPLIDDIDVSGTHSHLDGSRVRGAPERAEDLVVFFDLVF